MTIRKASASRRRWQAIAGAAILLLGLFAMMPARLADGSEKAAAAERVVIEKAIRSCIGWAVTKNRPLLESVLANDDRLFIFNPDINSTVGWNQFRKGFDFWMDPRFKMERIEIRNLRVDLALSRTVAWWSCILDQQASWDGRSVGWKDTRWTGVIEKRGGRWRIAQMHFSQAIK